MEGEEEGEQCDEHRARGAASCGRRGRVRRRDGRKSFSAVAFVDGASSVERQLWPAAETSRKKVLPGARSRRRGIERTVRRAWPAWTGGRRPRGKEPGESPSWLSPSRRPHWRETRGAGCGGGGRRAQSERGWMAKRSGAAEKGKEKVSLWRPILAWGGRREGSPMAMVPAVGASWFFVRRNELF